MYSASLGKLNKCSTILHKLKFNTRHHRIICQSRIYTTSTTIHQQQSNAPLNSSTTWLNGTSVAYIDEMYYAWKNDPSSVHTSWQAYFKTGTYATADQARVGISTQQSQPTHVSPLTAKVVLLVRAFQVRGHLLATLDPLGIQPPRVDNEELKLESYGFTDNDLDKKIDLSTLTADISGFLDQSRGSVTIRHIWQRLHEVYTGNIGYEYMHIPSVEKCNWIRSRIEPHVKQVLSNETKLKIYERLAWSELFENFLKEKYATAKRFGLEGAESFIVGMKSAILKSADLGAEAVVMGMPHRGRLNVLQSVVRKPLEQLFREFQGLHDERVDPDTAGGDVKYHLGMSHDRMLANGKKLHLSLLANPSHLECVNPLVQGKTRAKQQYSGDTTRDKSFGLLLHGDAAFAGQGVVYESMGLMNLPNYTTGGTLHMVINNQVGFTTDPSHSRSTPYCSDIGKAYNIPIFHVNGDDAEAVHHVCELAAEYRYRYKTDVIVDLVCYRKHGHNEVDEPMFTQPLMYKAIQEQKSTLTKYREQLLGEGVDKKEIDRINHKVTSRLQAAFDNKENYHDKLSDWMESNWSGFKGKSKYAAPIQTGVDSKILQHIGHVVSSVPDGFNIHRRLETILKTRAKAVESGEGFDWSMGEMFAFGSLLLEGKHVRLSGQDSERGTFSHRHSVYTDQVNGKRYTPLHHLNDNGEYDKNKVAPFIVSNSHLSEFGVMGFELGYSMESPHSLVMWEGQFGDFYNGAQVIVDQFITSGEEKWLRQTGLVLLLPHGYEGAGPEHSSARLERFLQQMSDDYTVLPDQYESKQIQDANMQVCNVTTPANYFHMIRRQIHREFRKPLIVMTPKSLLRHPLARSNLDEFTGDTLFKKIIPEHESFDSQSVKRHILCSGKIYYDLLQRRQEKNINNIVITRIEQIAPFPYYLVADECKKYSNAELVWCQEEPMNMGAWTYIQPRLLATQTNINKLDNVDIRYIGRKPSGSTAAGKDYIHKKEQDKIITDALTL